MADAIPCSFCQKTHFEVHWLVRNFTAAICDECIAVAVEAVDGARTKRTALAAEIEYLSWGLPHA